MINLSRIDGRPITINADEIETIESSHDTTVSLKSGKKIIVRESAGAITEMVVAFKRKCFTEAFAKLPEITGRD